MVVTMRPMSTGNKLRRASSNGLTLQIAAAGISAQGINVPPPTQIAVICPSAVNVAVPSPMALPNKLPTEPAKDMPENPEPSKPVIAPTTAKVMTAISFVKGTSAAKPAPRSLTMPWEAFGKKSPMI